MLEAEQSLRSLAQHAGMHVGVAVSTSRLRDARYREIAATQFNSLTAENEMKWETLEPVPKSPNFEPGDELLAFAEQNAMRVRGHTLVWHNQVPRWLAQLSSDERRTALLRHVASTVDQWRGRIAQWDVVNEAIADDGELRVDSPFATLGPGYIADAFRAAHEADPRAQLVYNDHEIEGLGTAKSDGVYRLVKRLKQDGVPIHGVGFQMHVDPRHWPTPDSIRSNMARFAALGLVVEVTEMDVAVGEIRGTLAQKLEYQRRATQGILAACLGVHACTGITFWGISDPESWLSSEPWARLRGAGPHLPLLFDAELEPKPMFEAVGLALRGR